MARGMAAGEPIVSQAQSDAFDKGYDRTFGERKPIERGRWVWDEVQQKLVRPGEQVHAMAKDAPICAGRIYENLCATDGTDIGTRAKRRDYMERNGLADPQDFKDHVAQKAKDREMLLREGFAGEADRRREMKAAEAVIGRTVEMSQKRYDAERKQREAARRQRGKGFIP